MYSDVVHNTLYQCPLPQVYSNVVCFTSVYSNSVYLTSVYSNKVYSEGMNSKAVHFNSGYTQMLCSQAQRQHEVAAGDDGTLTPYTLNAPMEQVIVSYRECTIA